MTCLKHEHRSHQSQEEGERSDCNCSAGASVEGWRTGMSWACDCGVARGLRGDQSSNRTSRNDGNGDDIRDD